MIERFCEVTGCDLEKTETIALICSSITMVGGFLLLLKPFLAAAFWLFDKF